MFVSANANAGTNYYFSPSGDDMKCTGNSGDHYSGSGAVTDNFNRSPAPVTDNFNRSNSVTDDFNRADGALTAPWVVLEGSYNTGPGPTRMPNIATDVAVPSAAEGSGIWTAAYYNSTFSNDQYAQIKLGIINDHSDNEETGVIARYSGGFNYYLADVYGDSGTVSLYMQDDALDWTQLGDDSPTNAQNGDTLAIRAVGNLIEVLLNGVVVISATDNTYTSGYPGIYLTAGSVDDFEAGSIVGLGSDWTTMAGNESSGIIDDPRVLSNEVISPNLSNDLTGRYSIAYRNESFSNDQYAKMKLVNLGTEEFGTNGVIVRAQENYGYYFAEIQDDGTLKLWVVLEDDTWTDLGTSSAKAKAGDTITLRAIGNSLQVLLNDVEVISATDNTYASGHPGIYLFSWSPPLDDFEAGSIEGLGSNWTTLPSGDGWGQVDDPVILGNKVINSQYGTTWDYSAAYKNGVFSNDQYAQVKLATVGTEDYQDVGGPFIRYSGNWGYYLAYVAKDGVVELYRMDSADSWTQLGNDSPINAQSGDTVAIRAIGNLIEVFLNGVVVISAEDGTYTGGQPGLYAWYDSLDDFEAGSLEPCAWKTINYAFEDYFYSAFNFNENPKVRILQGGDHILFEGGVTHNFSDAGFNPGLTTQYPDIDIEGNDSENISPDNPITIDSYGTGRATLEWGDTVWGGVYLDGLNGVTVRNLNFIFSDYSPGFSSGWTMFEFKGVTDMLVEDVSVTSDITSTSYPDMAPFSCQAMSDPAKITLNRVEISNPYYGSGIYIGDNLMDPSSYGSCSIDNLTIKDSTVNSHDEGIKIPNGSDIHISDSVISSSNSSAISLGGDSPNSVSDVTLYNNDLFSDSPSDYGPLSILSKGTGLTFKNNIFSGANNKPLVYLPDTDGVTFDYNLYHAPSAFSAKIGSTTYNTFADYQEALSQEANGINADPKFVSSSDFHLKPNSPAINAGTDVSLTSDIEGNPVPSGFLPDIGAYEYQDTAAPTGGSFTINNDEATTNSTSVTLNITCPTDDWTPIEMAFGDTASPTNWTACTDTQAYTLTGGDGTHTVYMAFRDGGGNTTSDVTNTIDLDLAGPALSFTDNVEAGPVPSDTITASWGDDATVKAWDYNADNNCSTDSSAYHQTDSDSMDQTTAANNGKYICLYAEDAIGNKVTLASANSINIGAAAAVQASSDNHNKYYKFYKKYKKDFKTSANKTTYDHLRQIKKTNNAEFLRLKGVYDQYRLAGKVVRSTLSSKTQEDYNSYRAYNGYKKYLDYKDKAGQ